MVESSDVLIIGAGLAGLSCAHTLVEAGFKVKVLERSAWVGGRCATKAPGPASALVDFGPLFVHGDDPAFLTWVEGSGVELVPGWPRRVVGSGLPCQPQAFDPLQRRYAVPAGLRRLPEVLAHGVDVVTGVEVERLEWNEDGVTAVAGQRYKARHGVVATAFEQTRSLLATVAGEGAREVIRRNDALLSSFASLPCLTVLAEYGANVPVPDFDVWYPEASPRLLLVSNESTKRPGERGPSLVIQARPGWSAERLEGNRDDWAGELLDAAADLLGPWARHPVAFRSHRWRFGRLGAADHLVRPVVLERADSRATWSLAGDLFDLDGGLQGAWRSGRALAQRLTTLDTRGQSHVQF